MASKGQVRKPHKKRRGASEIPNPGLPDERTVISEQMFVSPKGKRYRIIRTTEKDPYDPPDRGKKRSR
jgi:hypothetical protein